MEISSFIVHFAYIAAIFAAGLGVGYFFYEKINTVLNKFFKKKA